MRVILDDISNLRGPRLSMNCLTPYSIVILGFNLRFVFAEGKKETNIFNSSCGTFSWPYIPLMKRTTTQPAGSVQGSQCKL